MLRLSVILTAALLSNSALAVIQGGVQVGVRSADEQQNVQSFNVLVDPLPLIPVAAGLRISQLPQNGSETSFQIHGWMPLVPMVTPFAFADVVLQSKNDIGKSSGNSIGFGLERSMLPFISATLSVESGTRRFTPSDTSVQETNSSFLALLIGVQAGL